MPTSDDLSQADNSISIDEAKAAFNLIDKSLLVAGARKDGKPAKLKFPIWNKSKKKKIGKNEVIETPIMFSSPWSVAQQGFRKLTSFKKNGKVESHILELVADRDYLKRTNGKLDANFTGYAAYFDLVDAFLGGFNYKDGKLVGYVSEVDGVKGKWYGEPLKKGGRPNANTNLFCGGVWNCTSTVTYQVIYNPCGNNLCGPTSTNKVAQIVSTNCTSTPLNCHVHWGADWSIGDPTCVYYVDCSQEESWRERDRLKLIELELLPINQFFTAVDGYNSIPEEEWEWLVAENNADPNFLDEYISNYYENEYGDNARPLLNSSDVDAWCRSHGAYMKNGVEITEGVRRNYRRGKVFEAAALRSLGFTPNGRPFPSAARATETQNRRRGVIPDGTILGYNDPQGRYMVPDFVWAESKCINGTITLSSNDHQMLGFIDALSKKKDELRVASRGLANDTERPMLIFLVTGDAKIGLDVIQKATEKGVRLFTYRARLASGDPESTLYIKFGRPIPLNYFTEAGYISRIKTSSPGEWLISNSVFPLEVPSDINDEMDYDDE